MRSRLSLCLLAVALLVVASCSSTTVVARDDRSTAGDDTESSDAVADDSDSSTGASDEGDDPDDDDTDADATNTDPDSPRDLTESAGFGLGGAEQLASLLADCETGSDLACDVLFQLSDFESDEENAALTCGGRSETTVTFCSDGIDADGDDIVFDVDSDGLSEIVDLCETDADMTACDFLYYRSPLDSEFQEIGGTCGGRVAVAVPDCRTFLTE